MSENRDDLRAGFLKNAGWSAAEIEPLPADMSFRRYFRLRDGNRRALLMDAPPDKENIEPYVNIGQHLIDLGLSAPAILELDETAGFAVIEDFGNDTYGNLITSGANETALYELAVDTLAALHRHPDMNAVSVPPYDNEALLREALELVDWYYPYRFGTEIERQHRNDYIEAWQTVLSNLPPAPPALVLRDFHVDNLMVLSDRSGVSRCGLLDFQDAVSGHAAYDLVSLLEDARRDVADDLQKAMRSRYCSQMPNLDRAAFDAWYTVLGAQRHAKVVGRFVRFLVRDGNPRNLIHVPRVMRLLVRGLDLPALAPVKRWINTHLPNPVAHLPDGRSI